MIHFILINIYDFTNCMVVINELQHTIYSDKFDALHEVSQKLIPSKDTLLLPTIEIYTIDEFVNNVNAAELDNLTNWHILQVCVD